jgi:hypothetical protein
MHLVTWSLASCRELDLFLAPLEEPRIIFFVLRSFLVVVSSSFVLCFVFPYLEFSVAC